MKPLNSVTKFATSVWLALVMLVFSPLLLAGQWQDLTGVTLVKSARYSAGAAGYYTLNKLVNNTGQVLNGPVRLVVTSSTHAVTNASGQTSDGKPYFDAIATGQTLANAATGKAIRMNFALKRGAFSYTLVAQELTTTSDKLTLLKTWSNPTTPEGSFPPLYIRLEDDFSGKFSNTSGTQFFYKSDEIYGLELWKSDGTPEGTVLVKDINPGENSSVSYNDGSALSHLVANGILYFNANDGVHGFELWRSDGTTAGTYMVKEFNSGNNGAGGQCCPNQFTNVNGIIYFSAYTPTTGRELWKTDGTNAGTVLVKDIDTTETIAYPNEHIPGNSNPHNMFNLNGIVYFSAYTPTIGSELWKTDGTSAGTVLVKDLQTNNTPIGDGKGSDPRKFFDLNGLAYFGARSGSDGLGSIWKTDGTTEGTVLVEGNKIIDSVTISGFQYAIVDGGNQFSVWKSDGSRKLVDLGGPFVSNLRVVNGEIFYTIAGDLWKSDLTPLGTKKVSNIKTYYLFVFDGELYFHDYYASIWSTNIWWKYDSKLGEVFVGDLGGSVPPTVVNGSAYFSKFIDTSPYVDNPLDSDTSYNLELWTLSH